MKLTKCLYLIPLCLLLVTACAKRIEPGASTPEAEQQVPPPPPPPEQPEAPAFLAWESPPEVVKRVTPVYPEVAKKDSIEGQVIVQITIDESGKVIQAEVVQARPPGIFDQAALDAIKQWEFKPATADGKPIKVKMAQRIAFTLRKKGLP